MDENNNGDAAAAGSPPKRWLNRTVAGVGVTSALGDFCYETTTVVLPGFLAVLGVPAAALGAIEGAADALSSFTKMFSGHLADRLGHRKLLVLVGYALTPLGQAVIALATGWPLVLLGRLLSWFGKGLRGPLRDAIVVQAVDPGTRGRAFGFHRAMDTLGALVGPLLGVTLLGWVHPAPGADPSFPFRVVLALSIIPGVLAVIAFLVLVQDPEHSPNPALRLLGTLRALPGRFRRYLAAVGLFGLGDFSHSLLILAATQLLSPRLGVVRAAQLAGLLYVGRNLVQVLCSYPIGAAADRRGALRVLGFGYVLGTATALCTALLFWHGAASLPALGGLFLLAGLYVAVQEALESTVTAELVAGETMASSLGALSAVNGVAKLLSSTGVGVLWSAVSPVVAFGAAALLMAGGTLALSRLRQEDRVR